MKVEATSEKVILLAENEFEKQQLKRIQKHNIKHKYFGYIEGETELTIEFNSEEEDWGT